MQNTRSYLGSRAIPSDCLLQLSGSVVPYLERGVRSPSSKLNGRYEETGQDGAESWKGWHTEAKYVRRRTDPHKTSRERTPGTCVLYVYMHANTWSHLLRRRRLDVGEDDNVDTLRTSADTNPSRAANHNPHRFQPVCPPNRRCSSKGVSNGRQSSKHTRHLSETVLSARSLTVTSVKRRCGKKQTKQKSTVPTRTP